MKRSKNSMEPNKVGKVTAGKQKGQYIEIRCMEEDKRVRVMFSQFAETGEFLEDIGFANLEEAEEYLKREKLRAKWNWADRVKPPKEDMGALKGMATSKAMSPGVVVMFILAGLFLLVTLSSLWYLMADLAMGGVSQDSLSNRWETFIGFAAIGGLFLILGILAVKKSYFLFYEEGFIYRSMALKKEIFYYQVFEISVYRQVGGKQSGVHYVIRSTRGKVHVIEDRYEKELWMFLMTPLGTAILRPSLSELADNPRLGEYYVEQREERRKNAVEKDRKRKEKGAWQNERAADAKE